MDVPMAEASSSVKRPLSPMSSNAIKRAKLELPPEQSTTINDAMTLASTCNRWETGIKEAADDPLALKTLSSFILIYVINLLSTKVSTFPMTQIEAQGVIDGFSDDELREWEAGLQKGFQHNDWSCLIEHRASQFAFKRRVGYNCRDSETSRC